MAEPQLKKGSTGEARRQGLGKGGPPRPLFSVFLLTRPDESNSNMS